MSTLRCQDVSKAFGGIIGLSEVSVEMHSGEVTAIIGPNGAGKTTLFNVLTGILSPDSGRVYLDQTELTGLKPYQVARSGIVRTFQNLRLIRSVSVLENLMLAQPNQSGENILRAAIWFRAAAEERRGVERSMEILNFLNMESKAREITGELSYGEQKLVSLGCCLATGAFFLLLDEPLAGVHPELSERILCALKMLSEEKRCIVFIEHDLDAVRRAADKVIVMSSGRIIATGLPDDILQREEIVEAYLV